MDKIKTRMGRYFIKKYNFYLIIYIYFLKKFCSLEVYFSLLFTYRAGDNKFFNTGGAGAARII